MYSSIIPIKKARNQSPFNARLHIAGQKLEEGDRGGVVRHFSSDQKVAEVNNETLRLLKETHLPGPTGCELPIKLDAATDAGLIWVTITAALRSFPHGKSGKLNGLRPRHLLNALSVDRSTDTQLPRSLARLCELVSIGEVLPFA